MLTVTSSDADVPADMLSYSLTGGADQAVFTIDAATGELTFNTAPDVETPTDADGNNVYEVQVTADDGNGGTDVQLISVTVTDINESLTITSIADQTPQEDTATGPIAFTIGDAETAAGSLTVIATSSDQTLVPDGNITLSGSGASRAINIMPASNQNGGPATIILTVDDGNTSTQITFAVTVTAVNDVPDDITLSGSVVDENSASGTLIGTVSGTDPDVGDSLTFSLFDNAGGRFAVDAVTGQVTVADGSLLNFETSPSHHLGVRVTDAAGLTYDESYNDHRQRY